MHSDEILIDLIIESCYKTETVTTTTTIGQKKKILVIAPSWVGDAVMSQALLRLLKKQDLSCSIDVFANSMLHPLLKRMPEVDNCLISPFSHGELKILKRFAIAKDLFKKSYTHVYVLPNSFKSALIPFFAKIPHRIGWCGEQRYFLLNDIRFFQKKLLLMVERYVALGYEKTENLVRPILLPKLQILPEQVSSTLKRLQITSPQKPVLALCPGAECKSKCWPPRYFADIAKAKKSEGWDVWIFGSMKHKEIALEIQGECNNICTDLTGRTDLGEVVDLVSLSTLVVANDTGLMHIAAALNKPLVVIYGSSASSNTPPLTENKFRALSLELSCSPCHKKDCPLRHLKCLNDLKPFMVLQSINEIRPSEKFTN